MVVSGPVTFTLLGFWGVEPRLFGSYTPQLSHVIDDVLPLVEGPVILAGDFNAPIASTPGGARGKRAAAQGTSPGECVQGDETGGRTSQPAYYSWLREEHPFHIDHVFVAEAWANHLYMTIGGSHEWVASRRSDHVPLLVDIDTSAIAMIGQAAS